MQKIFHSDTMTNNNIENNAGKFCLREYFYDTFYRQGLFESLNCDAKALTAYRKKLKQVKLNKPVGM